MNVARGEIFEQFVGDEWFEKSFTVWGREVSVGRKGIYNFSAVVAKTSQSCQGPEIDEAQDLV